MFADYLWREDLPKDRARRDKEEAMRKSTKTVALDQHMDSITVAVAEPGPHDREARITRMKTAARIGATRPNIPSIWTRRRWWACRCVGAMTGIPGRCCGVGCRPNAV